MTVQEQFQLAIEQHRAERFSDAAALYQQILSREPNHADALHMFGLIHHRAGQLKSAAELIQRAVELDPDRAEFLSDLGLVLAAAGRLEQAIMFYRKAIAQRSDYVQAYNNLGNSLKRLGRLDEAIEALREAVVLEPDLPELLSNLANALKEQGEIDEAIELLRRAAELSDNPQIASNLLFSLHFDLGSGPEQLHEEHKRWNERFARALMLSSPRFEQDRSHDRRLRIGYVSCDFRDHTVARFMLPLLANHDHRAFEIFCYSATRREDAMTQRLRSHADTWRNVVALNDEQLAQLVRQDQIDILVDLAMHTDATRLLAFARRPAPVQVTYLAYAGTTGLEAMEYRFTDAFLDPPDDEYLWFAEKPIRLRTYWCYEPPEQAPAVAPPPMQCNGFVTFGCFNHASKISSLSLEMWRQLLKTIADSKLILHIPSGKQRERIAASFAEVGVEPTRIQFVDRAPLAEYFQQYQQIDIALDTFPYGGGATTCDALWMGVPVISLAGSTGVSRGGLSILSTINLPELLATTPGDYVRIAASLANSPQKLPELRASLRQRMLRSPLTDALAFARDVEAGYRKMWQRWCDGD